MRWVVCTVLWLLVGCESRRIARDPRDDQILGQIVKENSGIIEWIIEHIDDALKELEKESTVEAYECLVGLAYVAQDVAHGKLWAIGMIDSSAKIPDGLLQGNFNDLGVYDQCVAIENPNAEMPFTGMHCLVDFNIRLPENMTIEVDGTQMSIVTLLGSNVLKLTFGHCYPSVCKPSTIEKAYNALSGKVASFTGGSYSLDVTVNPMDCHLSDRDELQTSEWIFILVCVLVLFLVGISTTVDILYIRHKIMHRPLSRAERGATTFSLYTNGQKLLYLEHGCSTISCLNGLKFMSIGWVILGHRYRYLGSEALSNYIEIAPALKQWHKMIVISAPLAVDTFFIISSLLNTYVFFNMKSAKPRFSPLEVVISYVHRYIRLTPAYAVAVAFTSTLLYRCGNGPEWDRTIVPEQNYCRGGWWYNILYVNNYGVDNYCMMQSWYLSADMQMFWFSPFILYPLLKWPIFGFIELVVLLILSVFAPFYTAWYYEIAAPIPLSADEELRNKVMGKLYLPTHTKFTGYILGIALGYAIFKIRRGKWVFKMNRVTNLALWLVSAVMMLYAIFGGFPVFQLDYDYSRIYSSFYIGFYRLFWSLGVCWIILACDNGWAGPVNALLSWEIFIPLGKLSYCVYLTHIAVLLIGVGSVRHTIYYSDYTEVHSFLGDMVLCFAIASGFSLVFEAPLLALEKLIFERPKPKEKVTLENTSTEDDVINPSAPEESERQLSRRSRQQESTNL